MKLSTGIVCLYCALMAVQATAQSQLNEFADLESRRRTAEFIPAPYGTPAGDDSTGRWKRHWAISAVALVAASALDAGSSWGRNEANPVLQQTGHSFGGRSIGIKLGITAIPLLLQHLAARNNEGLYKPFALANYGGATFFTGVAVRNFGVPRAPGN